MDALLIPYLIPIDALFVAEFRIRPDLGWGSDSVKIKFGRMVDAVGLHTYIHT